eukprot:61885_1
MNSGKAGLKGGSTPPPLPTPEFNAVVEEVERALQVSKPLKHRVRNNGENKSTDPTTGGEKESTSGSELVTEDNSQHQLAAAKLLRGLILTNRDQLSNELAARGWIPLLANWLVPERRPQLQLEALWCLTNFPEHAKVLVKSNAVPQLIALLDSKEPAVQEHAMWLLGSLAGDGAASREVVLSQGALPQLVKCLKAASGNRSVQRIGGWTLSNLCDGQPPAVSLDASIALDALVELLGHKNDTEVLSHASWALSHLCDGPGEHVRLVAKRPTCKLMVDLLRHKSARVVKPALRAVGNLVCAEDDHQHDCTQCVIDAGAVEALFLLISEPKSTKDIVKEACWTLSNIAAGSLSQISAVLESGCVKHVVMLANDPATDSEVRNEAYWVVLNATSCANDAQIEFLVERECVEVLLKLLDIGSMVSMALEGMERVMQVGEKVAARNCKAEGTLGGSTTMDGISAYASLLPASKLEELERHKNPAVSKRASRMKYHYYISCAICQTGYPKGNPPDEVAFCEECKCYVCSNCSCSRFHLDYQEELWRSFDYNDKKEEEKRRKKKSKKKRGKKKDKNAGEDEEKASTNQEGCKLDGVEVPVVVSTLAELVVDEGGEENAISSATHAHRSRSPSIEVPVQQDGAIRTRSPSISVASSAEDDAHTTSAKGSPAPDSGKVGLFEDSINGVGRCGGASNDDLVTYLVSTGSILALARKLDEEDSSGLKALASGGSPHEQHQPYHATQAHGPSPGPVCR